MLRIIFAGGYRCVSIIPKNIGPGQARKSPHGRYEACAMDWCSEGLHEIIGRMRPAEAGRARAAKM